MLRQNAKKYLISGGAGFIGSFICEKLLNEGNQVICIDNLSTGSKNNIANCYKKNNFIFIESDITSNKSLKQLINEKIDYILHLASPAGPNPLSPKSYHFLWQETYLANSIGTHILCKFAEKNDSVFLFASSSEIYGDPKVHPQREDYYGYVNPIGPRSIYDESKRLGESITANFNRHNHLQTRIVRIFNTYGPRMNIDDGRALPLFISNTLKNETIKIFGNGQQTRSFCFIDDLVDGILKLLYCQKANAIPVNLGNPNEITIKELLEKIKTVKGYLPQIKFYPLPENDPLRRKPDISLATKLLDWKPKITLEEGLKKTFDYYSKVFSNHK